MSQTIDIKMFKIVALDGKLVWKSNPWRGFTDIMLTIHYKNQVLPCTKLQEAIFQKIFFNCSQYYLI